MDISGIAQGVTDSTLAKVTSETREQSDPIDNELAEEKHVNQHDNLDISQHAHIHQEPVVHGAVEQSGQQDSSILQDGLQEERVEDIEPNYAVDEQQRVNDLPSHEPITEQAPEADVEVEAAPTAEPCIELESPSKHEPKYQPESEHEPEHENGLEPVLEPEIQPNPQLQLPDQSESDSLHLSSDPEPVDSSNEKFTNSEPKLMDSLDQEQEAAHNNIQNPDPTPPISDATYSPPTPTSSVPNNTEDILSAILSLANNHAHETEQPRESSTVSDEIRSLDEILRGSSVSLEQQTEQPTAIEQSPSEIQIPDDLQDPGQEPNSSDAQQEPLNSDETNESVGHSQDIISDSEQLQSGISNSDGFTPSPEPDLDINYESKRQSIMGLFRLSTQIEPVPADTEGITYGLFISFVYLHAIEPIKPRSNVLPVAPFLALAVYDYYPEKTDENGKLFQIINKSTIM